MRILWFVSSLEQKGGGERFALEAVSALRVAGHEANIVCDRISGAASFDGRYDLSGVFPTGLRQRVGDGYSRRAYGKIMGLWGLLRVVRRVRPEVMICQSEYDAIKLSLLARWCRFRFRVFVFGQMFQFKSDISKYSSVFRRHLDAIASSRPGYRDTVITPSPRLGPLVATVNEIVSHLKYRALRAADRVYVLSNQVKWEVDLLYGCPAVVCRAAFAESYIDMVAVGKPRAVGNPVRILSVCRLVQKKRVELTISGFCLSATDAILIVVGSGPEERQLRELAASSTRGERICFVGEVDDDRLRMELAAADCFVSMDIGDFDIAVVEAMGKGLRVIVPSDFDLSEFGDGFTGVVSVAPTAAELAAAIDNISTMSAPTIANVCALQRLTWESLAETVTAN